MLRAVWHMGSVGAADDQRKASASAVREGLKRLVFRVDPNREVVDEYRRSRDEFSYSSTEEKIDNEELNSFIDINLPACMRMDYLKMLDNVYIPKVRKNEIIEKIQELSQEFGYEKG